MENPVEEAESESNLVDYQIIDPIAPISPWEFTTVDLNLNQSTTTSWAVFNKEYGGNCCEHYLATTIDGTILNIEENIRFGHMIEGTNGTHTFLVFSPTQCAGLLSLLTLDRKDSEKVASFKQQMVTSSQCLGSHTLEAISSWTSSRNSHDASEDEWTWCYNRITEPFYDRSWQVEVVGPIS